MDTTNRRRSTGMGSACRDGGQPWHVQGSGTSAPDSSSGILPVHRHPGYHPQVTRWGHPGPTRKGEQEDPRTGRALSDPNSYTRSEGIGEPQHLAEDPRLPAALRDRAAVEPVRVDAAALGRVQNVARLRASGAHTPCRRSGTSRCRGIRPRCRTETRLPLPAHTDTRCGGR